MLSLLSNVFGLVGGFKRRVAIVILHLIGAYVSTQCSSHLFLFLAERFATFLPAQFIATASPDLLNLNTTPIYPQQARSRQRGRGLRRGEGRRSRRHGDRRREAGRRNKGPDGGETRIRRIKDGRIMIACGGAHLDGFKRFAELADAIER